MSVVDRYDPLWFLLEGMVDLPGNRIGTQSHDDGQVWIIGMVRVDMDCHLQFCAHPEYQI
jgi:hypothetical protein